METKITDVIDLFKTILKDPIRVKYDGICTYAILFLSEEKHYKAVSKIFNEKTGYYKNYLNKNRYLFEEYDWQSRDKFMREEIKNLKQLIKKGYAHI